MINTPNRLAAIGLACAIGPLAAALPQNATPTQDKAPAAPAAPAATAPKAISSSAPRKRTLFREGSSLLEAAGTMRKDPNHSNWVFTTTTAERPVAQDPDGHTFILLPCVLLGEMQQIHDANPQSSPVVFELTGTIFTYRNRNYLLPTFAPRLIGHAAPPESVTNSSTDPNNPIDPNVDPLTNDPTHDPNAADEASDDNSGHSVEDIMNRIREATGPVTTATSDDRDLNLPRSVTGRTPILDTDDMIREGTDLINRRGRIVRDAAGSWTFVFDADAQGLADPPMTVLPCNMLESMERVAARAGNSAVMLLTGSVYSYGQRNYIMPSVFRIPNDRSGINAG